MQWVLNPDLMLNFCGFTFRVNQPPIPQLLSSDTITTTVLRAVGVTGILHRHTAAGELVRIQTNPSVRVGTGLKLVTKQVKFTDKEAQFLEQNEICRFATASKTGQLHIVPVSYVSHEGLVYIVTDYGTKKLRNLRENPNAAVLVDTNATRRAVMISGRAELIEKGEEYRRIYKLFHSRLAWVRRAPWKEGEAPFVKITPTFKTSWGLGK